MDDSPPADIISIFLLIPRPHTKGDHPSADTEEHWDWVHGLDVPHTHISAFCAKPCEWLRFVSGALLGARGVLREAADADAAEIEYERALLPGASSVYFHTDHADRARVFPPDPSIACTSFVTISASSACDEDFFDTVVARDGCCVITRTRARVCDAAHLICQTKGNAYIEALTRARSGGDGAITDIDDVRNALLVNTHAHRLLVWREIAFLQTPNFAMSTRDVDPAAPPDAPRWTVHDFEHSPEDSMREVCVQHGAPLCVPPDESRWPPRVLFDVVYGAAAARYFGHVDFAAYVKTHWPRAAMDVDREARAREKKAARVRRRRIERRREESGEMDPLDMVFCIGQWRSVPTGEQRRAREAEERRELEEKVASWRGDVG